MSESNQAQSSSQQPSHKTRNVGYIIASIIVIIMLVVLVLPSLISTAPGTRIALRIVNSQIPGSINVKSLSIGWVSGQYIEGFELLDPQGQEVVAVKELQLPDISLGSLISGSRNIGNVNLNTVDGNIVQQADGRTNIDAALSAPKPATKSKATKTKSAGKPSNPLTGLVFALDANNINLKCQFSDIDPIVIDIPASKINFKNPADIDIQMNGSIAQGNSRGMIDINATAKNLLNNAADLNLVTADLDISGKISDLPIDALDRILQRQGKLLALIGPTLDADINAKGNISNLSIQLATKSEHLNANADFQSTGTVLQTAKPSTLSLSITPESWQILSKDQDGQTNSQLQKPVTVELTLNKLDLPIKDNEFQLADAQTEINLNISQLLVQTDGIGIVDLRRTNATLQSDHLATALIMHLNSVAMLNDKRGEIMVDGNIQNWLTPDNTFAKDQYTSAVKGRIQQFPLASILDDLFGKSDLYMQALGATIESTFAADYDAKARDGKVNFQLTTAYGNAVIDAALTPEEYKLTQETVVNYSIQPQLLKTITGSPDLELTQPANVVASVEQLEVKNAPVIKPSDVTAGLTVRVDNLVPASPKYEGINLRNFTLYVHPNTKLGSSDIPIQLAAKMQDGSVVSDLSGSIHVSFLRDNWASPKLGESFLKLDNLAVRTLDRVADQGTALNDLIGPTIDTVQLTVVGDLEKQLDVRTLIKSQALNGTVAGRLDTQDKDQTINISPKSKVIYTLTPERYAAYTREQNQQTAEKDRLRLLKPVNVEFRLTDGSVPLSFKPEQIRLKADVTATEIAVKRGNDREFYIKDFTADATANNLMMPLVLDINADILQLQSGDSNRPRSSVGQIRSRTAINNLYNAQGQFDAQNMTSTLNTKVTKMPIDLVDQMGRFNGDLIALIGPTADLTLTGTFPGDIDLVIKSQTLDVPAYVNVTRDYVLTLRQDFEAELKPTPQTFSALLSKAQPVLADAISSEQPVRLYVKKERFALPLTDFKTQNLNMTAQLDLGSLQMKRQGWLMQGLSSTLSRLGLPFGNRNNAQTYTATFTPMTIVINNGVVEPSQIWMTSSDMAIGFQVRADLNTQRLNAFMGILGASFSNESVLLSQSFNADQIYNVPISGTIDNPKVDWNFLYLNIAGTTGTKAITENTGDLGTFIGGIAGGIGQSMNEDKLRKAGLKAWNPPPAALALAQRTSEPSSNASPDQQTPRQQRQEERREQRDNNPINNLLDGLFR